MSALKLTDEVLFDTLYSFDARAVLAATQGHQGKNPSVDYLAALLGLKDETVMVAQRELETTISVWGDAEDGEDIQPLATWQLVTLRRPTTRFHGGPTPLRFTTSTSLEETAPWASLYVDGKKTAWTELPAKIAGRLPKRSHNNSLIRVQTLAYAREQLRRGAVQIEDEALGYLIGASARQVRRVRELLIEEGVLVFARRDQPCNVYTLPGATPGRPENPDDLDLAWTRRLTEIAIGPSPLRLYACATELESIAAEVERLTPPYAWVALGLARPSTWNVHERHDGRAILATLKAADPTLWQKQVDRVGGLGASRGGTSAGAWGDGVLPSTSNLKSSVPNGGSQAEAASASDAQDDLDSGERRTVSEAQRRNFGPDWYSTFYFADEPTHAALKNWQAILVNRYGQADAAAFWREACFQGNTRGQRVLEALRRAFPHIDPDAQGDALGDLIGDFQPVAE